MKTPVEDQAETEAFEATQPRRLWWKRRAVWISGLVALLVAAPLIYYFFFLPKGQPSASSGSPAPVDYVQSIVFSPDGHTLASTGADFSFNPTQDTSPAQSAYIELRDATTGKQVRILT